MRTGLGEERELKRRGVWACAGSLVQPMVVLLLCFIFLVGFETAREARAREIWLDLKRRIAWHKSAATCVRVSPGQYRCSTPARSAAGTSNRRASDTPALLRPTRLAWRGGRFQRDKRPYGKWRHAGATVRQMAP